MDHTLVGEKKEGTCVCVECCSFGGNLNYITLHTTRHCPAWVDPPTTIRCTLSHTKKKESINTHTIREKAASWRNTGFMTVHLFSNASIDL